MAIDRDKYVFPIWKKECVQCSFCQKMYMYFDSFTSSREIPPEKRGKQNG